MAEQTPPITDKALPQWSGNMAAKLIASPSTWGATEPQASDYHDQQLAYVAALAAARNPDTRGPKATKAKEALRATLIAASRDMIRVIRGQLGLSDEQLFSIGVPVRQSATVVPVPDVRPGTAIKGVSGRTISVQVTDADVTNKRGKPGGCVAAWAYYFVGETYPSDPTAWNFAGSSTKAQFDIAIPATVAAGAQVWVCAAWINAKQEAGPVSFPLTTRVQGGEVSTKAAPMKLAA